MNKKGNKKIKIRMGAQRKRGRGVFEGRGIRFKRVTEEKRYKESK
jgi:hypothetical protein